MTQSTSNEFQEIREKLSEHPELLTEVTTLNQVINELISQVDSLNKSDASYISGQGYTALNKSGLLKILNEFLDEPEEQGGEEE